MNKHLRELAIESKLIAAEPNGFDPTELTQKQILFAELIVRECIEQSSTLANHYIDTHSEQEQAMLLASIADYSTEIRKHFGVDT